MNCFRVGLTGSQYHVGNGEGLQDLDLVEETEILSDLSLTYILVSHIIGFETASVWVMGVGLVWLVSVWARE